MDIEIIRSDFRSDGIFGAMFKSVNALPDQLLFVTLEHAYRDPLSELWVPKVCAGTYTASRHAPNRLPYETFMLLGVPPFQGKPVDGILFHILNFSRQSRGCIGLGRAIAEIGSEEMITQSRNAFEVFMQMQAGVDEFQVTFS